MRNPCIQPDSFPIGVRMAFDERPRRMARDEGGDPASELIAFCAKHIPPVARDEFERLVSAFRGETAEDGLPNYLRRRVHAAVAKVRADSETRLDAKFPDLARIGCS
jgi:hypothetical protein